MNTEAEQRVDTAMRNGVEGMIGETAIVTRMIASRQVPGSIRIRGEEWLSIPLDPDASILPGTNVVVAAVERGLLVVFEAGT